MGTRAVLRRAVAAAIWPLRLIRVQVALIYLTSGLFKLFGAAWRDGSAVYYATGQNIFGRIFHVYPVSRRPWTGCSRLSPTRRSCGSSVFPSSVEPRHAAGRAGDWHRDASGHLGNDGGGAIHLDDARGLRRHSLTPTRPSAWFFGGIWHGPVQPCADKSLPPAPVVTFRPGIRNEVEVDARKTIRRWLPPAILDFIRGLRHSSVPVEWEYRPHGWSRNADLRGWNVPAVSEAQRANWQSYKAVVEGTGPLGVIHTDAEPNGESVRMHNTVLGFAYALALAAGGRSSVSLLDWGGGVGHYYPLARALLADVEIRYTCLDVPALCESGRELNPGAEFVSGSDVPEGPQVRPGLVQRLDALLRGLA